MSRFAEGTKVPESKTKVEIEEMIRKYGANQFMSFSDERSSSIAFTFDGLLFRFSVPMPKDGQKERDRLWRVIANQIKSKLIAVAEGVSDIPREFMSNIATGPDTTLADDIPEIKRAAMDGRIPSAVLSLPGRSK